jgi:uncharacterized protein YrrD
LKNLTIEGERLGLVVGLRFGLSEGDIDGVTEGLLVGKDVGDCRNVKEQHSNQNRILCRKIIQMYNE